jgi:hypothetical protein
MRPPPHAVGHHQRRTLVEGAFIADEICSPVPHRHLVLTIPRPIRNTFKFDRALLGELHALDPPEFPPGLPYPQPRDEPIRFRVEVTEPGEDFDQTGFELPPPPQVAPADAGQGELFGDDYAQPDLSACTAQADAADGEPVFWPDAAGQSTPDDDFVQADAVD